MLSDTHNVQVFIKELQKVSALQALNLGSNETFLKYVDIK